MVMDFTGDEESESVAISNEQLNCCLFIAFQENDHEKASDSKVKFLAV